jgi:hypothetical protein
MGRSAFDTAIILVYVGSIEPLLNPSSYLYLAPYATVLSHAFKNKPIPGRPRQVKGRAAHIVMPCRVDDKIRHVVAINISREKNINHFPVKMFNFK